MLGNDPLVAALEAQLRATDPLYELGWAEFAPGVFAGVSCAPVARMNGVWVLDQERADLDQVRALFDRVIAEGYPYCLRLRGSPDRELSELTVDLGLEQSEDCRFMTLADTGTVIPEIPSPLEIRELPAAGRAPHLRLTERTFGMPDGVMNFVLPPRVLACEHARAYMGSVAGQDVCTALSFTVGDATWLYNVGTVEEFRGRGYGRAITAHAVAQAARDGATTAFLETSDDGFPVYRRLGFEHAEYWTVWEPAE